MFHSRWRNHISTAIPRDVTPESVTTVLHNHGHLITLSPIVTRYAEAARAGGKITYDVWENIDLLPCGWWCHEISFRVSFEDTSDGVISWIEAPMGLTSRAAYSVVAPVDESSEPAVLDESIESACSVFLRPFVERTMVATRLKMHSTIIEKAKSGGDDS